MDIEELTQFAGKLNISLTGVSNIAQARTRLLNDVH